MTALFFALSIIVAMLAGAAIGAYATSEHWKRELYHVRRGAERDLQTERDYSARACASAWDLHARLTAAYDLIAVLNVRARRSQDLPVDRILAIESSTPKALKGALK